MNKIDLTKTTGTYSNLITNNLEKINNTYYKSNLQNFKSVILEITAQANETEAKRNFVNQVNKMTNKDKLLQYVYDVYLRAQHLGTKLDDKWANEK